MNPGIPYYEDDPFRGGVDEAIREIENQIELLKEELDQYENPIVPSWYSHFSEVSGRTKSGKSPGRDRQVKSLTDDINRMKTQLERLRRTENR